MLNSREEMVGLGRFELPTSRLSGVRSNQLSYRPSPAGWWSSVVGGPDVRSKLNRDVPDLDRCRSTWLSALRGVPSRAREGGQGLPRKEVIQPQVLLQLPCYDFTPIASHSVGACPPCGLAQRLREQLTFVM